MLKIALASLVLLSGCADYLNRDDCVTLGCGDTQKANMLLQTANPFNPASEDTAIPTDGQRAVDITDKYRNSHKTEGGSDVPPLPTPQP